MDCISRGRLFRCLTFWLNCSNLSRQGSDTSNSSSSSFQSGGKPQTRSRSSSKTTSEDGQSVKPPLQSAASAPGSAFPKMSEILDELSNYQQSKTFSSDSNLHPSENDVYDHVDLVRTAMARTLSAARSTKGSSENLDDYDPTHVYGPVTTTSGTASSCESEYAEIGITRWTLLRRLYATSLCGGGVMTSSDQRISAGSCTCDGAQLLRVLHEQYSSFCWLATSRNIVHAKVNRLFRWTNQFILLITHVKHAPECQWSILQALTVAASGNGHFKTKQMLVRPQKTYRRSIL